MEKKTATHESSNIKPKIKKNKKSKPLYWIGGILLALIVIGYFISKPSERSKALTDLESSYSKRDIELIWDKYKDNLHNDDDFLFALRTKLSSLNLSKEEIEICRAYLPPAPVNINVIVIPDLSRRIIDTINNPNQVQNDIFVLKTIWNSFVNQTKLKIDSKDKFMIDVTDIDQAKGQFQTIANNLLFDLSTHKHKSNRLYFTSIKDSIFAQCIDNLYRSAIQKPLGADYKFYLRRYLINHLKQSNLFDTYKNKVIIITDGYLEAEGKVADTQLYAFKDALYKSVNEGNTLDVISKLGLNIGKVDIDFTSTDILICEVNERKAGKGYDFEILKSYWSDWFKRMNAKTFQFVQREQANSITAKQIEDFMNK